MNGTDSPASGGTPETPPRAEDTGPSPVMPGRRRRTGLLLPVLGGVLALALCAGLVVQIGYQPGGWPGVYADTLHGGFRGPYGGYPAAPSGPNLPTGYRTGSTSRVAQSYLYGGLRIDVGGPHSTDVVATRVDGGTRYWQYHHSSGGQVTRAAVDRPRHDLFLAWQADGAGTSRSARLERVDVHAARTSWHVDLNTSVRTPGTPYLFPSADVSGRLLVVAWGDVLTGVDRSTGRRRWTAALPSGCATVNSATVVSLTLVVGLSCGPGRSAITGVDTGTGRPVWLYRATDPPPEALPAPTEPMVPDPGGDRPSTRPTGGSPEWPLPSQGTTLAPPLRTRPQAQAENTRYSADPDAPGYGTGSWRRVVAVGGGLVAVPSMNPVPVLSVTDGRPLRALSYWPADVITDGSVALATSCLGGDAGIPVDSYGRESLCATDPLTGRTRWTLQPPDEDAFASGVQISRGRVYVLLHRTDRPSALAIGIADEVSGKWLSVLPLPSSVPPGRLAAVHDGILLIVYGSREITMVPTP